MRAWSRAGLAALLAAATAGLVAARAEAGTAGSRGATVKVLLNEWKLIPSVPRAPAGRVTFVVENAGQIEHEFVVLRTSQHHRALTLSRSVASEAGKQGELEPFDAGTTQSLTVTLKPGNYVLLCNLLGHYMAGQHAGFRVG